MGKLESSVVDDIIKALHHHYGGVHFKVHGGMYQRKGFPDILWWCSGKSYAFEVKRPHSSYGSTPLQEVTLAKLAKQGVITGVVLSAEETLKIVRENL